MNDYLSIFSHDSLEYLRLEQLAELLTEKCAVIGITYAVQDCYFDIGQNWRHTTIIATNEHAASNDILRSWQALTPDQQRRVIYNDSINDVANEIFTATIIRHKKE